MPPARRRIKLPQHDQGESIPGHESVLRATVAGCACNVNHVPERNPFLSAGANLVEIDLNREGNVFPDRIREILRRQKACYGVCIFRAGEPTEREVYPIRLHDRLPAIRIPLRPTDEEVVLDVQPLINQCHERGRYHMLDYGCELDPPLAAEDAAWVDSVLRERRQEVISDDKDRISLWHGRGRVLIYICADPEDHATLGASPR